MATSLQKDVENIIICTICQNTMTDARRLPCQHSFCYQCIESLPSNGELECPKCSSSILVNTAEISLIPQDFTINTLVATFKRNITQEESVICATCPPSQGGHLKLDWFCKDCQDFMCESCANTHRTLPVFDDHELVKSEKCPEHPKKEKSYICTECQALICSACVMTKHQKHPVKDAKKYLATCRKDLETMIVQMKGGYPTLVAQTIDKVDIEDIEASVHETMMKIAKETDEAAKCSISWIEKEQTRLQASLGSIKKTFDSWVCSIKDGKLLQSNVKQLVNQGDSYISSTTSGEEALNEFKRLKLAVDSVINQIASNVEMLSSFGSIIIPTGFSASTSQMTLGTIDTRTEVQPGFDNIDNATTTEATLSCSANISSNEDNKIYNRTFLLEMQGSTNAIKKPDDLPEISDITKPRVKRHLTPMQSGISDELWTTDFPEELCQLIAAKEVKDEKILEWIQRTQPEEHQQGPVLINQLMQSICKKAVTQKLSPQCWRLDESIITRRTPLLKMYMNNNLDHEVQGVYALQEFANYLHHPEGMLRELFMVFHREGIISEEAFENWEAGGHPTERAGRKKAINSVCEFFIWLAKERKNKSRKKYKKERKEEAAQ